MIDVLKWTALCNDVGLTGTWSSCSPSKYQLSYAEVEHICLFCEEELERDC